MFCSLSCSWVFLGGGLGMVVGVLLKVRGGFSCLSYFQHVVGTPRPLPPTNLLMPCLELRVSQPQFLLLRGVISRVLFLAISTHPAPGIAGFVELVWVLGLLGTLKGYQGCSHSVPLLSCHVQGLACSGLLGCDVLALFRVMRRAAEVS